MVSAVVIPHGASKRQRIFGKAIRLLEKRGWTKHDFHAHGRYCAAGALFKVGKVLKTHIPISWISELIVFNDSASSRNEVIREMAARANLPLRKVKGK